MVVYETIPPRLRRRAQKRAEQRAYEFGLRIGRRCFEGAAQHRPMQPDREPSRFDPTLGPLRREALARFRCEWCFDQGCWNGWLARIHEETANLDAELVREGWA